MAPVWISASANGHQRCVPTFWRLPHGFRFFWQLLYLRLGAHRAQGHDFVQAPNAAPTLLSFVFRYKKGVSTLKPPHNFEKSGAEVSSERSSDIRLGLLRHRRGHHVELPGRVSEAKGRACSNARVYVTAPATLEPRPEADGKVAQGRHRPRSPRPGAARHR